jgi:hypothetical protein
VSCDAVKVTTPPTKPSAQCGLGELRALGLAKWHTAPVRSAAEKPQQVPDEFAKVDDQLPDLNKLFPSNYLWTCHGMGSFCDSDAWVATMSGCAVRFD